MFTIPIELYAAVLLVFRIAAMSFMAMVIIRQLGLFKLPIPKEVVVFRRVLFILSLSILIGNIVPAAVDVLTIFIDTGRPRLVFLVSWVYSLSNATTALLSAYLIWRLYRLSANEQEITELTTKRIKEERDA